MADVIVFWDDAPAPEDLFPMRTKGGRPYGNTLGHYHCGCCPNCRCTPMPLVFAEDLKFPVRVYTNGKIIRMNQRDFDRLYREKSGKLGKPLPRVNEEKPRVSLVSDEMTSEELSRKAKEQKRDDKGRFSREGKTGQENSGVSAYKAYGFSSNVVDTDYIMSDEYEKSFDRISDNPRLNKSICNKAREMLLHRNGTKFEDACIFDVSTGDKIAEMMDSNTELSLRFSDAFESSCTEALLRSKRSGLGYVMVHNHPNGSPPSPEDFNNAFTWQYDFGIIVGHDGSIYKYYRGTKWINEEDMLRLKGEMHNDIFLGCSLIDSFKNTFNKLKPNCFVFNTILERK